MSILNQFTMVQLTIDNAKECQIPNPQSHITNRQTRPRVPDVPSVPFVPSVSGVSSASGVSGVSFLSFVSTVSEAYAHIKK